ncbi:MAG: zinc ribbon domain-containing protein [Candidatus Dadabacteria bacterium]|nr:MAG: zinc ribbon domain-containing protein [Candidatus Dadabacteria bacterium]
MPIYEYECESCGKVTEVRQAITEDHLKTCAEVVERAAQPTEACGKPDAPVVRLISPSAFVLKGTGWYKTDYASGGSSGGSSDSGSGDSSSQSSSSSD